MRKWVWLAAAAVLAVATPSLADTGSAMPTSSATDDTAVKAALDTANTRFEAGDIKGAESDLTALIKDPRFHNALPETQADVLWSLAACENRSGASDDALKHMADARTIYPDIRGEAYWVEVAYIDRRLNRDADLGDALTAAVTSEPERVNAISGSLLFETLRRLKKLKDGDARRRQLLEALAQAHYDPDRAPTDGEALRLQLFKIYVAAGEDAKARALVPTFIAPDTVITLRADNRYRKLVIDDPNFSDFKAVQDSYINGLRSREAAGGAPVAQVLADALMKANRLPEALKVIDDALALGDLAPGARSELGDQAKWLLDSRRRVLELMGRWDEVEAVQIRARDAALKEGRDLVSQRINLADLYNRLGRPQDALKELSTFRPEDASIYGQMVVESVRACAYAGQGDKDRLKASLDTLRAHKDQAPGPVTEAVVCAGDEDGAAALLIARLDDPDQRSHELFDDQDYLPAPHPTAFDQMIDDHMKHILRRPDVQAAVARYGVIESYPAFAPDN